MPITFLKTVARLEDACTIEDAEELLGWLLDNPDGRVNPKRCTYMHTAVTQVLMGLQAKLSAPAEDPGVAAVLEAAGLTEAELAEADDPLSETGTSQ